jgi:hypothetical protein
MKTKTIIVALVSVLLFTPALIAQESGSQLYTVIKHSVIPGKIDEYKELMKKFASACEQYGYPSSYYACQSTYPDFYYFYPLFNYHNVEKLRTESWKVISNMESDYAQRLFNTIESWDQFFIRRIDSLSYTPDNYSEIRDDLVYSEWWVNYYKVGTGEKYREAFKQAIIMNEKEHFDYPISRFQSDIGMNGPAIVTVFWGKNPSDLYNHVEKDWEILGEEVRAMIDDFRSTIRKFEKIPFWYQEELSFIIQ